MTTQDFFDTIFDYNEYTSFAKHSKGTNVYKVDDHQNYTSWVNFFSINPINPLEDTNPIEEYHSADRPRRCDKNVMVYRNILIEMDKMSLEEQDSLVKTLKMPYTTKVFSGGKSYHFIISLEEPVETEQEYRALVERVHKALGGKEVVDTSCKNPSRFSRFPGVIRHDKGTEQTLLEVKERVKLKDLQEWVASLVGEESPKTINPFKGTTTQYDNTISKSNVLNGFTLNFIMMGATEGDRNNSLFKAACDMAKCGYNQEEALEKLSGPSKLEQEEIIRTIKSAYNRVQSEQ